MNCKKEKSKEIINIILNHKFFNDETKKEITNIKNLGFYIVSCEIEHLFTELINDQKFGKTLDGMQRVEISTTTLTWSNKENTIIDTTGFNWFYAIMDNKRINNG